MHSLKQHVKRHQQHHMRLWNTKTRMTPPGVTRSWSRSINLMPTFCVHNQVRLQDRRTDRQAERWTDWPNNNMAPNIRSRGVGGAYNIKILTKASTHLSSFIVPQQPQNARRAMVPPPAMIRYVAISNIRDPTRTEISRALYSVTSSHIPMPSTPKPMIWNTKVFLIKSCFPIYVQTAFCCMRACVCVCCTVFQLQMLSE